MLFFERLLPESGYICTALALPQGGFSHRFFQDIPEAIQFIQTAVDQRHTMYLAQSGFSGTAAANWDYNQSLPRGMTKEEYKKLRRPERTGSNVCAVRSFWFDIDCGAEKFAKTPGMAYPTQKEAALDLKRFVGEAGFPMPTIVNSGNGLYAHWFMDRDLEPGVWRATAQLLKDTAKAFRFKADDSRTADYASVLRPPGAVNFKDKANPKIVRVLGPLSDPFNFDQFLAILTQAAKFKKVSLSPLSPPKHQDMNSEFLSGIEGPTSSAHILASRCAQIRKLRDAKGDVTEPLWYASLGVLRFTVEADEVTQDWSSGHPDYSEAKTAEKVQHHINSGAGPTTCVTFSSINPEGCLGCKFKDKIKTPLSLGRPEAIQKTDDASMLEVIPDSPLGFIRAKDGLYFKDDELDIKFFRGDLYPVSLAYDYSLGYETATFRHVLPHNGIKDFTVRSSTVQDPKAMLTTLHDNHVQVLGKKEKNLMIQYCESYLDQVRSTQKLKYLFSQMGWCTGDSGEMRFILGDRIFSRNGIETAGMAKNIPDVARAFHTQGDAREWSDATRILNTPGMEPLAFALLAGTFGAPLLKFTGYAGALVSMIGPSGVGKTLIGKWALSAYGDPDKLVLLRDDTRNMLISRLGLYGTLPLYVDEVTNIEAMDLSDLVYRITQGRDKGRLGRDAREKAICNSWNTIALSSSNSSLIDKLGYAKQDAGAEMNRVFEYRIPANHILTRDRATKIYRMLTTNYGGIGEAYIQELVKNPEAHQANIDRVVTQLDLQLAVVTEERFWTAVASASLYGGIMAKRLGLIQFDISPIVQWVLRTISSMRVTKKEYTVDPVSLLGQFLNKFAGQAVLVTDSTTRHASLLKEPHGSMVYRLEIDKQRLFVSKDCLRRELHRNFGSYDALRVDLAHLGVLVKNDARKNLGAGTYLSGVQEACWEIDMSAPILGHMAGAVLALVKPETKAEATA